MVKAVVLALNKKDDKENQIESAVEDAHKHLALPEEVLLAKEQGQEEGRLALHNQGVQFRLVEGPN